MMIYDTFLKKKRPFQTLTPGKVKMYVCGPTVYDRLHIGNFRGPIFFNLVAHWLRKKGHEVIYVFNYTDVDDKIIQRANEEGVPPQDVAKRFIKAFEEDYQRLGLSPHTHNPRATETIPQMIRYIEALKARGMAYQVGGEVFYSVEKFSSYGALSGKKLQQLRAGARVEVDPKKKNPLDFVLWRPDPQHGHPSPWGPGRPGWHIECSAMIFELLGQSIDLHGGGVDLIFPHHENERAQGEGCFGETYCHHWMHHEFVNFEDQKMSKSLGNVVRAKDFMDEYHPEVLKFIMLSRHYRLRFSISEEVISEAMAALARIYWALNRASTVAGPPSEKMKSQAQGLEKAIVAALDDDFQTASVMGSIYEFVRLFNQQQTGGEFFQAWIRTQGAPMALFQESPQAFLKALDGILLRKKQIDVAHIDSLVQARNQARQQKNWPESDRIRKELEALGIVLFDSAQGTSWEVKKGAP